MRKPQLNIKRQALLAERAHGMRRAPTASEAALWRLVAARKLGVSFRRQVPLGGRFIADFLAPSAHLVLEVDGACHRGRGKADARRDRALAGLGYRVLRLEADLVLQQPAFAIARIRAVLAGG
jgi:very-short-patch-repair endonuclease